MPWSGIVYRGEPSDEPDEDRIEYVCAHQHKTRREARKCGERMAALSRAQEAG